MAHRGPARHAEHQRLASAVVHPPHDLGRLSMLAEDLAAARAAALCRHATVDVAARVAGLVFGHAASRPDAVAIIDGDAEISYREVARRIRLATRVLDDAGVRPGDVVAIMLDRSAVVPVLFLALEELGAMYLPVEPSWPESRQRDILSESGARLVVSDHVGPDDKVHGVPAVMPPDETGTGVSEQVSPPDSTWRHTDPSREPRYVIYTSGSTGKPKGAVVEHQGMVNHLAAKIDDLDIDADDSIAFTAPIGFDISIWQMLCPLMTGATLVVVDDVTSRFPRRFIGALRTHRVTIAEVVPTVADWLADELPTGDGVAALRLRWLLTTGEELGAKLAGQLLAALPAVGLVNAYGPTECSDDVTHHVVTLADSRRDRIPIGGPISNCTLYLLVSDGENGWSAAPPGEKAELFVGGVAVGLGYLGRPELTGQAFFVDVLDPDSPTGRLYRTGDLVEEHSGALVYLGRVDRQVKVAGVRLELDEIEAVISRHEAVAECATTIDADSGRIIAWVAAPQLSAEDVRGHAARWLPAAAVPSLVSFLEALPRTNNGKVDYRALAESASVDPEVA